MGENDKITLCYVIWGLGVGGAEKTLVNLANNVDHNIFDVHICTVVEENTLKEDLSNKINYHSASAKRKEGIFGTIRLVKIVKDLSPDLVQTFLLYGNGLSPLFKLLIDDAVIITGVRSVPTNRSNIFERVERFAHSRSDYVVSNSKSGKSDLEQKGINKNKIRVINNGRDLKKYSDGVPAQDIQEIGNGGKIVGSVGRLIERKGHLDLIEAWRGVEKQHPEASLVIVGDGPMLGELKKKSDQYEIESVYFLGYREDIPSVLAALDIFVFPSWFEGLPGAIIEAMGAGLPIITTPVNGCSELITDGKTGVHVSVKSPPALEDAISKLITYPEYSNSLGKNAKNEAMKCYTINNMVNEFEKLYQSSTKYNK